MSARSPLMRVEHGGEYASVASTAAPRSTRSGTGTSWPHPDEVIVQDGPEPFAPRSASSTGDERTEWWERSVAAYPPYAEYQERTDRVIPVVLASRVELRGRACRQHRGGP